MTAFAPLFQNLPGLSNQLGAWADGLFEGIGRAVKELTNFFMLPTVPLILELAAIGLAALLLARFVGEAAGIFAIVIGVAAILLFFFGGG